MVNGCLSFDVFNVNLHGQRVQEETSGTIPENLMFTDDGFGVLVVSMLASGTQVCGFKPGRSRWNIPNLVQFSKLPIKVTSTKNSWESFYQFSCCFTRSDKEILLDTPLGCEQPYKEKETTNVRADRAAAAYDSVNKRGNRKLHFTVYQLPSTRISVTFTMRAQSIVGSD